MSYEIQRADSGAAGRNAARRPPGFWCAKGRGTVSRAFTLIELLVVVGVIVLLIGILVPTLGAAKNRARATQTQALISHLAANINGYFQHFNAYPGPLDAARTTAAGNKISGTQNLMLGLSYGFIPGTGVMPIPGTAPPAGVEALQANGPVDYGNIKPDGTAEQLSGYFEPTSKQVFEFYATNNFATNNFRLPVAIDAFTDGLPILYYRRNVGSENAAAQGIHSPANPNPPGYYYDENREYTGTPNGPATQRIVSSSGTPYYQNTTYSGNAYRFTQEDLNKHVSVDGTTNGKVRGGFVLISAGIDRYYGTVTTGTVTKPTDDIVQVGGD